MPRSVDYLPNLGGGSVMPAPPPPAWFGNFGLTYGGPIPSGPTLPRPPTFNPNAPPVNIGNAPPPSSPDNWGPMPGSGGQVQLYGVQWGRGPVTRKHKFTRAADYSTFEECVGADPSDAGVEACARQFGMPDDDREYFEQNVYQPVETVPLVIPGAVAAGAFLPELLAPIITGVLLWPTAAGKGSDLRKYKYPPTLAVPAPAARPAGPRRRGRGRPVAPPGLVPRPTSVRPRPAARPSSGPVTISRPTIRAPAQVQTGEIQAPRPTSLPPSVQIQVGDISSSAPGVGTMATPTATAAVSPAAPSILSTVVEWASNALPFLPLALPFAGASLFSSPPQTSVATYPLTGAQPNAVTSPATAALPQSDACSKARTRDRNKRKRRKPCTNPTVSSRLETRGGKRYQIIKRWLKCPALSRKKRRSPLAR